jgi:hypothetical protein
MIRIMASTTSYVQAELDILLATMARELGVGVEEMPLELEVVARASLEAAHAKGRAHGASEARGRRLSQTFPAVAPGTPVGKEREERPTDRPPPPPQRGDPGDEGVYMYTNPNASKRRPSGREP